jgi:tetratricopeptide (TPR) repeat protein
MEALHIALEYYNQALSISRERGDRAAEAKVLTNVGAVYEDGMNQPQIALDYYSQALSLFREVGDSQGETEILQRIKTLHGILDF